MSTEIKNTLFRFVTMRAPELSEEKNIKDRFVFMAPRENVNEIRIFEDAVKNKLAEQSKWEAMIEVANDFTPISESDVKDLSQNLYDFGVWIAKNKHSFSVEEMDSMILPLVGEMLNVEKLNQLWDNLFYQIITKKDFYAKEAIMHLLIGNHVAQADNSCRTSLDLMRQVAKAKVVLPRELFIEEDGSSNGSISRISSKQADSIGKVRRTSPTTAMKKLRENHNSKIRIDELQKLKKELLKAETKYKKEYKSAYDSAFENYQSDFKILKDDYDIAVKKAKQDWCALQNPQATYDPKHPCNQSVEVKAPDYPKFNFSFKNEMDWEKLDKELSPESMKVLLPLLDVEYTTDPLGKVDITQLDDPSGDGYYFAQTYEVIDNTISQNEQIIANNLPSQANVVTSVGGVVVPITSTTSPTPFSFELCPVGNGTGELNFDIKFEVPDSSWVVDAEESSHQILGTSVPSSPLVYASQIGNSILVTTGPIHNYADAVVATSFEGKIVFENGNEATFSVPNSMQASIYKRSFSGNLRVEISDDDSENNSNSAPTRFIPPGFGFKQIGIADYKKVEQTTQGYVEGDVAHIENIMAREYKEKATRRLRRSENTTTTSSESEKEKLTDTTSTDRYEMQTEVAKILQEATDFAANAGASYTGKVGNDNSYTIGGNVNMATHSSNEESTLNAVNQAKEITERAMDRIVSKVKEERIEKIIEEFEENNKHGFDNTKGDKHVVGVYRWVDKIFKNQVYNYGKRLMFEFMIPQPSKLHILGMEENRAATRLVEPIDPRKCQDSTKKLADYSSINEVTLKYWSSEYNIDLKSLSLTKTISDSFSYDATADEGLGSSGTNKNIPIPEGYKAVKVKGKITYLTPSVSDTFIGMFTEIAHRGHLNVCDHSFYFKNSTPGVPENYVSDFETPTLAVENNMSFGITTWDIGAYSCNFSIQCEATDALKQQIFNMIISAYEDALVEFNQKLAQENALGVKIKGENPGFYRQIENMILRKNCISYMINQDTDADRTYGKGMFNSLDPNVKRTFGNHEVNVSAELDDYTAFAKFMEQAFEWEIMSYNFYPYYWGDRNDWGSLYQYDNNDPLFRNFMQAGMARVIVTVRPGFEEAVRFYLQTGEIWNGGEVPVIEDPLFLSLVDELQSPKGKKEGKAWATRLPTTLTILQANNIGLNVTQALPFDVDALSEFENPSEVPVSEQLLPNEALLGTSQSGRIVGRISGNENKEVKITLTTLNDQLKALTYCDADGNFELNSIPVGTYQLNLDANNDFSTTTHQVTVGSKIQQVYIAADQVLEINMTVAPLD